jgi:predicted GNAT family acetyltransferase
MRVVRHTDAALFSEVAIPWLATAEAENNLLLGICAFLAAGWSEARPPYLATVEEDGRPVAVAIMVPPHKVVLSTAPPPALRVICGDLLAAGVTVPGANGPAAAAAAFAEIWRDTTGDDVRRERRERIYLLTKVVPPRAVSGTLRLARAEDLPIVQAWARGFVTETGLVDDAPGIADRVRRAVRDARLHLWDADGPVSMAAWAGPTPNGVRVNLVYTPPSLRGRGYASACVAALSASLLASGRRFCFLFTDLANPTSNSIYMKIGYRPVCDVDEYRFERRPVAH